MHTPELSIDELFRLDIDELYESIGKNVIAEHREALPGSIPSYLLAGKAWMKQKRTSLSQLICRSKRIQTLMRQKNQDRIILAAAMVDLLTAAAWNVAPTTVAVLLTKEGIDSLCGEYL